ncbi:MAG: short chain dehydrogenase [Lentisphaerae bacterium]|nr:short chain dehydrogenase [Lentisphaerota bacterium]MCP4102785.1 short chain dehydrogenase [Lentisphaerota bacterium]
MRIIIVGASGIIGKALCRFLKRDHEVIAASRSSCEYQIDITKPDSVKRFFDNVGKFDALVCTVGESAFVPLSEADEEQFMYGINSKLLGQVRLVSTGMKYISNHGSFTLTSGIISEVPGINTALVGMVDSAIEGFVRNAAYELERGIRINVVSPNVLEETYDKFSEAFPGFTPISLERLIPVYRDIIEGVSSGQVIKVFR